MRILIVSDIHANFTALQAIREPFDVCLNLGDLVDYGPDPAECVRWSMTHCAHAVRGNHDHGVAQRVEITGEHGYRYLTRVTRPLVWAALDAEQRRYLLQLPLTRTLVLDNKRFLLVHATPRDPLDEYVMRDPEAWTRRLERVEADFVCVGHSHMQFVLQAGGATVINPGSVGQPRDGDPRAAYAVIEDGKVRLRRVEYPVDRAIARFNALDLPEKAKRLYAESLANGRLTTISTTAPEAPDVETAELPVVPASPSSSSPSSPE